METKQNDCYYKVNGKMIGLKVIDSEILYSFKDVCDLMNVMPKERTTIGRKVKPFAQKINTNKDNEKIELNTFVNKNGLLFMINYISSLKKYFYYYKFYKIITGNNLLKDVLTNNINNLFNILNADQLINNFKKNK